MTKRRDNKIKAISFMRWDSNNSYFYKKDSCGSLKNEELEVMDLLDELVETVESSTYDMEYWKECPIAIDIFEFVFK